MDSLSDIDNAPTITDQVMNHERGELQAALQALEGQRLPPAPITPLYRLGMFLVAFAMLLLPLVYFGLVGAVAYLVYRLPTDPPEWAQDEYGGVGGLAIIGAVIGVIFVIFMIKPIFARPEKAPELYKLKPGEAPELEHFVNRVADVVGAPRPREIEVNCDVNAAAGFRRGLLSLFGRDLKLIIGLPLMAGMSLRSFGGVLAHEFGHFSQGAGMRLTYIIRVINAWFVRLVYQRDRLDAWLDGLARNIDLRIAAILWTAKLLIWISRRILWCLMYLGHGISCFALRQMEFDADRYEVAFAGSEQFAPTSRRLQLLNFGAGRSMELLQETWQQGKISRNYPELTRRQTERLPGEIEKALDEALAEQKTGLLDTHPCDSERIAEAEKAGLKGIFNLDLPASVLMEDFDELCRRVTRDFYTIEQGLELADHNLVANDIIGADDEMMGREIKAIDRFFCGQLSPERPVFLGAAMVNAASGNATRAKDLCARTQALSESLKEQFEQFDEQLQKRNKLWVAQSLKLAGFSLKPENVGLTAADLAGLPTNSRISEEAIISGRDTTFADFDAAGRDAMIEALSAVHLQLSEASGGAGSEGQVEMRRWLNWMEFFEEIFPRLMVLKKHELEQGVLIENIGDEGVEKLHLSRMKKLRDEQSKAISYFRPLLEARIYPFSHVDGDVSLWDFIDPKPPAEADAVIRKQVITDAITGQLLRLYQRVLGQLAIIAEQVIEECDASPDPAKATDSELAPQAHSPNTGEQPSDV